MKRASAAARLLFVAASTICTTAFAENESFETPALEHVLTVRADIDAPIIMGRTPQGQRRVIPISGGTFEGPSLKGSIMPGGEDWQVVREDGVTLLDARYSLRTEDGTIIRVHNRVLINPPSQDAAAGTRPYVRSSVEFEAPVGKYDWLNKGIFVGTLTADTARKPPLVTLRFFKVR